MVAEDQSASGHDSLGRLQLGREGSPSLAHPVAVVVMGVSGCGKSTVGRLLAERLGARFVDADDLHSDEAKAKMAAGTPLSDDDRWPWLHLVGNGIARETRAGRPAVVACSALRRVYRDVLRDVADDVIVFVHLHGTRQLLGERLGMRVGHFMPQALLGSQLATLESLEMDELGIAVDISLRPVEAVVHVLSALTVLCGAEGRERQSNARH
jgi:carbohydrate kinase (thermoresistant glucokinase family)